MKNGVLITLLCLINELVETVPQSPHNTLHDSDENDEENGNEE